ncbi:MAG: CAP domain-containing protein [Bacteroidetes bacterium]|nr:CAP domain-containing protein [Bacteroidota bacterium]
MNLLNRFYQRIFLWLITLITCVYTPAQGQNSIKQGNPVPVNFCIKEPEMKLFRMVNEYRQLYNLPPIALSKSLCYVASIHARDLMLNHPDQGSCNFHSWSNKGSWIPFCYPKDETKKYSVWDKPRELTTYPAKAFEIVYWENTQLLPDSILMVWKTEDYFNAFLLNTGKWQGQYWNAIGIAVFENYACAWFGLATDPQGSVIVCGSKIEIPAAKDTAKTLSPSKKPVNPKNKHSKPDTLKSVRKDSTALKNQNPLKEPKPSEALKQTPDSTITNQSVNSWYVIVKTNLSTNAAHKLVEELRLKEYPQAKFLEKDGKTRVSVFGPSDKASASAKMKEVKKIYKDAWLLRE